jgi:hypothetical protein
MRPVEPEKPIFRFPRTKNVIVTYVAKLRARYPPPEYSCWHGDGSMNPADIVLQSLVKASKKKLRKWCRKHAMETWGNKRRLIRRMYLHWRASKFGTGDPQIGYGKGYECVGVPTCSCGFRKRADLVAFEKRKQEKKEIIRRQKRRTEELWNRAFDKDYKRRFPRLRFPRFKDKELAKEYYKVFERMVL